jgi:hypothetical protein
MATLWILIGPKNTNTSILQASIASALIGPENTNPLTYVSGSLQAQHALPLAQVIPTAIIFLADLGSIPIGGQSANPLTCCRERRSEISFAGAVPGNARSKPLDSDDPGLGILASARVSLLLNGMMKVQQRMMMWATRNYLVRSCAAVVAVVPVVAVVTHTVDVRTSVLCRGVA